MEQLSKSTPTPHSENDAAGLGDAQLSLTQRTLHGVVWRFIAVFSKLIVQVVVMVVLSHILPVEDFGQLSLALVVVGLAAVVSEVGVVQAVIQRLELTARHVQVAFTLSVIFGTLMTAVVWACAPQTARLLGDTQIVPLLRIIALTFALDGVGMTAGALLQRRLEFRRMTAAEFSAYVAYGTVAVVLACLGLGAQSMAWALIVQSIIRSTLLLIAAPHPMAPSLAKTEVGHLLGYGVGMGFYRIANYGAHNADYLVVGRWLVPRH